MQFNKDKTALIPVILVGSTGLLALLSLVLRHVPPRASALFGFDPYRFSHYAVFLLGIMLIYLALQLAKRKISAYWLTLGSLLALSLIETLHAGSLFHIAIYLSLAIVLARNKDLYRVRSDGASMRSGVTAALVLVLVVFLFSFLVFTVLDQQYFGRRISSVDTASTVVRVFEGKPVAVQLTAHEHRLIDILKFSLLSGLALTATALFQPIRIRSATPKRHISLAAELIRRYPSSPEDFFKIWPEDKHYYFYGESFIAYKVSNGVAFVLDGASGSDSDVQELRPAFMTFARGNGWLISVLHADKSETDAWHDLGMKSLYIGAEAFIDVEAFVQTTVRSKHFRYVVNKARKQGFSCEIWKAPHSADRIESLRQISDDWLANGRREYGFIMGYFDTQYLNMCDVAVVLNETGKAVAYCNVIPEVQQTCASVDHIRYMPDAATTATHFLLAELLQYLHVSGKTVLNLGLAPLSKLEEIQDKTLADKVLMAIKRFGNRYYSFRGLEQFKGKFEPDWQARYMLYEGTYTSLAVIVPAMSRATSYKSSDFNRPPPWYIFLAILTAVGYASFPLALFINPRYLFDGLVSVLGADGQPYNWLFNSLDIISAVLGLIMVIWLARRWRLANQKIPPALIVAGVALVGAFIAAVLPLPEGYSQGLVSSRDIAVVAHGAASLINSAGFVASSVLWGWMYRSVSRRRIWFASLVVMISTLGYAIGALYPTTSPLLQRFFITSYAVWLVGILTDLYVIRSAKSR